MTIGDLLVRSVTLVLVAVEFFPALARPLHLRRSEWRELLRHLKSRRWIKHGWWTPDREFHAEEGTLHSVMWFRRRLAMAICCRGLTHARAVRGNDANSLKRGSYYEYGFNSEDVEDHCSVPTNLAPR